MTEARISESTIRRLSVYLRLLRHLEEEDVEIVSSRQLAARSGTTPAQVRKDLSLFGSFGKRGRGYRVRDLSSTLREILGLAGRWRVAVVGVGKIGSALLGYADLARRGFDVVAAFDTDPTKVDREVFGVRVRDLRELEGTVREAGVEIAVLATPPGAAAEVADRLERAGVRGILNFAPVKLEPGEEVEIRNMDVVLELEGLSFLLSHGRLHGPEAGHGEGSARAPHGTSGTRGEGGEGVG